LRLKNDLFFSRNLFIRLWMHRPVLDLWGVPPLPLNRLNR
jgi:hypothetical protein